MVLEFQDSKDSELRNAMKTQLRITVMLGLAFSALAQGNVPIKAAGIDLVCCGVCKPRATGPTNSCYGYYPTCWRTWPAECGPCAPPPALCEVPAPTVVPPSPPSKPEKVIPTSEKLPAAPATPKAIILAVHGVPVPVPATPIPRLPPPSAAGWNPLPSLPPN